MNILDAFSFLGQTDFAGLVSMFWILIIFEFPRYMLLFLTVGLIEAMGFKKKRTAHPMVKAGRRPSISVVIAGHNEASAIETCLDSINEQTVRPDEIIAIDDGSTDKMRDILMDLRRRGRIDMAMSNQVRCGKSSSCNLGFDYAKGDIIINIEADCSFDRDAIERIIEPFDDPRVGAVSGNIGVRNSDVSTVAALQTIEYMISISLGKRAMDMMGMVACASGAFGAFRREALRQVGGNSSGPGEDFDLTTKLKYSGWKIRFADKSWCMTDVPATLKALTNQRRRWDRDTIRIRMRKYRAALTGSGPGFRPMVTLDQVDYFLFNLVATFVFPAYISWLFWTYGSFAWVVIAMVSLIYVAFDIISFAVAVAVSDRPGVWKMWPYLFIYGTFNAFVMRLVRLYAYFEEWVLHASKKDRYVPDRVQKQAPIF